MRELPGTTNSRRGFFVATGIVGLGTALGLLALEGKPSVIRRPDRSSRPVLLVADFDNRTGRGELVSLARELSDAVRERLGNEPDGIFAVSPRRVRPVFSPEEREEGLLAIAGRLGADYVLAGGLEAGAGVELSPGSAWGAPEGSRSAEGEEVRLDVLLVHNAERPHVFAERFPLGAPDPSDPEQRELAMWVADRIALSLRQP